MEQPLIPTPAAQWKGKVEVEGTDLMLPSDNVARVKQMSPQAFITSGLIPDSLSNIVRQAIHSKQGLPPTKVEELVMDPTKVRSTLQMFDMVCCNVIIEPQVKMPPTCTECGEYNTDLTHGPDTHEYTEGVRDPDVLYIDTVDLNDKVFIFQWCMGGVRNLESFREQLQTSVGSLPNGQDVPRTAKRTTRRK